MMSEFTVVCGYVKIPALLLRSCPDTKMMLINLVSLVVYPSVVLRVIMKKISLVSV